MDLTRISIELSKNDVFQSLKEMFGLPKVWESYSQDLVLLEADDPNNWCHKTGLFWEDDRYFSVPPTYTEITFDADKIKAYRLIKELEELATVG